MRPQKDITSANVALFSAAGSNGDQARQLILPVRDGGCVCLVRLTLREGRGAEDGVDSLKGEVKFARPVVKLNLNGGRPPTLILQYYLTPVGTHRPSRDGLSLELRISHVTTCLIGMVQSRV
jgi:hypothetical protein